MYDIYFKEMTDIHQKKIELEEYIKINKHKVCKDREIYIKHCMPSQVYIISGEL